MLQIIGWLGCVYLVVKGLELLSREHQSTESRLGASVAFVGAFVFAVWFLVQGRPATVSGADAIANFEQHQREAAEALEQTSIYGAADRTDQGVSASSSPSAEEIEKAMRAAEALGDESDQ